MNKLKDFFYDKNDILVALIILGLAALIVTWRVDAIMEYPERIVAEAGENAGEDDPIVVPPVADDDPVTTDAGITSGDDTTSSPAIDTGVDEVQICAVYINYGEALETVAANCVTVGLIESAEEFMQVVNDMGAGNKIQAGQHHIPSNVTPEELVEYLLKPGL